MLDTNIIIDHLRLQRAEQESVLMKVVRLHPREAFGLSMLSIQELYEGRSTRDAAKEQYLLATISPLKLLPYTYEVAKLAGELARDLVRPIELADAAIAATALSQHAPLLTINTKDFAGIKELELLDY